MDLSVHHIVLSLVCALAAVGPVSANEPPDVRIVIDVSGSMKRNDPRNLRVPALKLLVDLLPPETRAGIWLFAEDSHAAVGVGAVDDAWRSQAQEAARTVHSRGLLTDIEKALQAATRDWDPGLHEGRSVILLTDGMLDVGPNPGLNAASRQRVLNELIPALQRQGAKVHTISLSKEADRDLMRQLAVGTDGWHEEPVSATELQRVFLRMFQKAVPQDTVPLQGNKFHVDPNVSEFSVLAVLKPGAKPTRLTAPDGTTSTAEATPATTRWRHDASYDLITVEHPATGEWSLDADVDPDNRVAVVTDLRMRVEALPNQLARNDRVELGVVFEQRGNALKDETFLALLAVRARLGLKDAAPQELTLTRQPGTARFAVALPELPEGVYQVGVGADGKTFQREAQMTFEVLPDWVRIAQKSAGGKVVVTVTPGPALDPATVELRGQFVDSASTAVDITAEHHEADWLFTVPEPQHGQSGTLNLTGSAKRTDGSALTLEIKPVAIAAASAPPAPSIEPPPPEHPATETAKPEPAAEEAHPPPLEEAPPAPNWVVTAAVVGVGNAVLGGLVWFAARTFRRRELAKQEALLQRINV